MSACFSYRTHRRRNRKIIFIGAAAIVMVVTAFAYQPSLISSSGLINPDELAKIL